MMLMRVFAFLSLAVGLTCGVAHAGSPTRIQEVRIWAGPENTRVVLDITRPVEHTLFTLRNPDRVVIDLHPGVLDQKQVGLPAGMGHVQRVRSANQANGDVRVVLDLKRPVQPASFYAKPNETYGHRLVIDLKVPGAVVPIKTVPRAGGRDVIIAIDPGHGGEDPGARGRKGTHEKNVVLAISRALKKRIDREPGFTAVLTRDGDYFLTLRQRIDKARLYKADMFVSVHADAFKDKRAKGSSVYVLSSRGASDEAARWLAERENAADLVGGVSLDDKDDVLASVLLDLSQSATISASMRVGEDVIHQLAGVGRVRRTKVQHAGFVVLKSPDIPSILVETAFISNPQEEQKLRDPVQQNMIAQAIMGGVRSYFRDNPPAGTLLASNRSPTRDQSVSHTITRGDTLSGIASRYNISIRRLRSANGLKGDKIRAGQVLTIPAG